MKTLFLTLVLLSSSSFASSLDKITYKARCAVFRTVDPIGELTEISVALKPGESAEVYNDGENTYKVHWEKNSYLGLSVVNTTSGKQHFAGVAIKEFPAQIDLVSGPELPNTLSCWYPDTAKKGPSNDKK